MELAELLDANIKDTSVISNWASRNIIEKVATTGQEFHLKIVINGLRQ
jgi:hypothetical protein